MGVEADPLDDATTASGANIPTVSEGKGQEIDAAMAATNQQMDDLGLGGDDLWNSVLGTESNNTHLQPDGSLTTSLKVRWVLHKSCLKLLCSRVITFQQSFDMAREM